MGYYDTRNSNNPAKQKKSSGGKQSSGGGSKQSSKKSSGRNSSSKSKKTKRNAALKRTIATILLFATILAGFIIVIKFTDGSLIKTSTAFDSIDRGDADGFMKPYIDEYLGKQRVEINVSGKSKTISLSDYGFEFNLGSDGEIEYVTENGEQYIYATTGSLKYNQTKLRKLADGMVGENCVAMVQPYYVVDYEAKTLTIYEGSDGWGTDIDALVRDIELSLASSNPSVTASVGATVARNIDVSAIYSSVSVNPKDAYTTESASGEIVYHDEIIGVNFSKNEAEKLVKAGGGIYQVSITTNYPDVTVKDLKAYTFPDLLSEYFTYYNTSNTSRSNNLALAAEYINGTVLEPGQQFSFNDTVGERTAKRGFKKAGVFGNEGNDEAFGGGICQTSSTLYYTCILSNLQIDERKNHRFTVTYMRDAKDGRQVFGNDATVNWGYIDYKFTNSKEYPIKIEMEAKGGEIYCRIYGTADGSTADFVYDQTSVTEYKIMYKLPDGSSNQSGHRGRTVKTYRVVYQDGVKIDKKLESDNTYIPMTEIYYTNDIPTGFEYGVEYDQDYDPSQSDVTGSDIPEQEGDPVYG